MRYANFHKLITTIYAGIAACISNLPGSVYKTTEPTSTKFVYEETIYGKTKKYERLIEKSDQVPFTTTVSIKDYSGQKITIKGNKLSVTEERKEPENIDRIHITYNAQDLIKVSLINDSDNTPNRVLYVCGRQVKIHIYPPHELELLRNSQNSKLFEQTEVITLLTSGSGNRVVLKTTESSSQTNTCPTIEIDGFGLYTKEGDNQLPPTIIEARIDEDNDEVDINIFGNNGEPILMVKNYVSTYSQQQDTNTFVKWMTWLTNQAASLLPRLQPQAAIQSK